MALQPFPSVVLLKTEQYDPAFAQTPPLSSIIAFGLITTLSPNSETRARSSCRRTITLNLPRDLNPTPHEPEAPNPREPRSQSLQTRTRSQPRRFPFVPCGDVCGTVLEVDENEPNLPFKVKPPPFFTLLTGPRRSLSLKLSDTRVYEPQIRARLGTTTQPPTRATSTPPQHSSPDPPPFIPLQRGCTGALSTKP